MGSRLVIINIFFFALLPFQAVFACPDRDGLVDLNCDGKIRILTFGDSITFGTRDSTGLGYPGRLKQIFPNVDVVNLGKSGEKTSAGKNRAPIVFSSRADADYVIILEGVNDYWESNASSSRTLSNLLSIQRSGQNIGALSMLSTLTRVRRSYQKSWVLNVTNKVRPYSSFDFYSLGEGVLSSDDLHPNGQGYQTMAEYVASVLLQISAANRPVDSDGDGIYDFAESRFSTNPFVADSDGDGLTDGEEVFTYGSSPLVVDTDGDGLSDFYEVRTLGSDPANPRPGAPIIQNIQAVPLTF